MSDRLAKPIVSYWAAYAEGGAAALNQTQSDLDLAADKWDCQ